MGDVTLNYTVTLILTLIAVLALGGCAYKVLNPNCDPVAIDKFTEFLEILKNCANGNCRDFSFSNIPNAHKILLESTGGATKVQLSCGGRASYKYSKTEKFGVCEIYEGEDDTRKVEEISISKVLDDVYIYNGKLKLSKVGDKVCFVKIKREADYRPVVPTAIVR